MGKRQKAWAVRVRSETIQCLGGECVACGSTDCLEFDCIVPCGHDHHLLDTSARMCFYRKQYQAGNLQVLCSSCHTIKTNAERKKGLTPLWV